MKLIQRKSFALAAIALLGSSTQAQTYNCTGLAEWGENTVYTAGQKVKQTGQAYEAKWWTTKNSPVSNSGTWDVWKKLGACGPVDTIPPSVPLGLAASNITTSSIKLSWNASTDNPGGSGIAGYEVLRGGQLIANPTSTSYTDTGLSPSTAYSYSVRAKDIALNRSALSSALLVSTAKSACNTVPATPTGLNSPSKTSSSVALSWNPVAPSPNCTLQYRILQSNTNVAQGSASNAQVTGLNADTAYSFSVQAFNEKGSSLASAPISVRTNPVSPTAAKNVIGYFAQWGIYARNYLVKNIDSSGAAPHITHVNYAFGNVRNNRCEVGVTVPVNPDTGEGGDAYADYIKSFTAEQSVDGIADKWDQKLRGNWGQLKKLKAKYPKLKVLISLGGWTYSRNFSSAARPENRVAFVESCINAYIKGNLPQVENAGGTGAAAGLFDGIDIDWEYPASCGFTCGVPEDKDNFTALMAEFRKQLNGVRPGLLLTMAAPAGIDKIRAFSPGEAHPYMDFINVMSYDLHGGWENITNFHSPLYGSSADPSTGDVRQYNTDAAIQAYLARGVPASKLNMGIGYYGRGWANVSSANNGLYQTGVPAPGTYDPGVEDYKVLKSLGWPSYVDTQSRAQWIFKNNTFWSFDTPVQITEKMNYVKSKNLGGALFWEFSGDDSQATLTKAIGNGLK